MGRWEVMEGLKIATHTSLLLFDAAFPPRWFHSTAVPPSSSTLVPFTALLSIHYSFIPQLLFTLPQSTTVCYSPYSHTHTHTHTHTRWPAEVEVDTSEPERPRHSAPAEPFCLYSRESSLGRSARWTNTNTCLNHSNSEEFLFILFILQHLTFIRNVKFSPNLNLIPILISINQFLTLF